MELRSILILQGFKLLRVITDEDYVMSVAFSPNGLKIAFGSADGTVSIWNANTSKDNSVGIKL